MLYWATFALLALVAGAVYQRIGSRRDAQRFPAPGQIVAVGDLRLHLNSQGQGSPCVVFDSALGGSSLSWALVQPQVARFTRACSYDRAGTGWSSPGPQPRTAERYADELHRLLKNAGLPPPYILVGHSYGGLTARLFAARHPLETAGLVLLDAADVGQWTELKPHDQLKIERGARMARRGVWAARLGLARLVASLAGAGALGSARRTGGFLVPELPRPIQDRLLAPFQRMPSEVRQAAGWFWTRPEFYQALSSQIAHVPASAAQVAAAPIPDRLPVTVISASENEDPDWAERQETLTRSFPMGRHLVAEGSSHWIPIDRPDLVVEAVRQMVEEVREGLTPKRQGAGRE